MPTPLLQTKLFVPPVPPELVSRPRLLERLEAGLHRRATLVSAPAGFGKTTLLSQWVHQSGKASRTRLRCGWLSLDNGDNEPVRYWTYFLAALQTIEPGMGQSAMHLLEAPQSPAFELFLTHMINDIATSSEGFALILDDYHAIENVAIHNGMTYLLEHMPPRMHLVIATRTDPPLPLARLRGRGQLNVFSAADLRFTFEETEAFFNEVMKLGISKLGIKALENRT